MRFEHYVDGFPEQSFTPNGHAGACQLAGDLNPAERTRTQLIAPVTVAAREVARTLEHLAARRASRTT